MKEIRIKNACAHGEWTFITTWEVMGRTIIRRKCNACGHCQDGEVREWENSPTYELSKSN